MTGLLDVLAPSPDGDDAFTAPGGRGGWVNLFGGQLVAQAVGAASRTVEDQHRDHAAPRRNGPQISDRASRPFGVDP